MLEKKVGLIFSPEEYRTLLGDVVKMAQESALTVESMRDRLDHYIQNDIADSPGSIQFHFDRKSTYDYFLMGVTREVRSFKEFDLLSEENLLTILRKPRLGLKTVNAELTLDDLFTSDINSGKRSNPTDSSPSADENPAPAINHLLRRQVREEMNKVYFGSAAQVDLQMFSTHYPNEVLPEARQYFLNLLVGRYEMIETCYSSRQLSLQMTVERALCAYLGFHDGDHGFLFKDKDKEVAELLIGKVKHTTYTNKEIARRAFTVLVGTNYQKANGFEEFKKTMENPDSACFKDPATLAYINHSLKEQVVQMARILYDVPEKDQD